MTQQRQKCQKENHMGLEGYRCTQPRLRHQGSLQEGLACLSPQNTKKGIVNSEKWEIKSGGREISAQSCQESCESYVRALRKKWQCLTCLLKNSSWGQSGQWQGVATDKLCGGKDLQLEWRKVRGQTKEIRRGNPQDLGIDWVDCGVAGVVKVDNVRMVRSEKETGSRRKMPVTCWFSFEAQLWASSTGIRHHPVRKYPTAVWSKRIFHDNRNLYLSCPKWQQLATCSYWAFGSYV